MIDSTFKSLKYGSLIFLFSFFSAFSAYGDDIEIYYGISGENKTVDPNVIFIFDTSGSMAQTDGTNTSRMFKSREALKIAMNNLSGVNISLMRFSDRGGPVLIPATNADEEWPSNEVVRSIYGTNDFAVSRASGTIDASFAYLGLLAPDHNRRHALRFTNMEIPKGAIIESAHITYFSVASSGEDEIQFTYVGSLRNDPEAFVEGASYDQLYRDDDGNVALTATTCTGTDGICWEPNGWPSLRYPVNTPDLSGIVQEIIDNDNWSTGDPILIFGQANGQADRDGNDDLYIFSHAETHSGSMRERAPQLRVRYSVPATLLDPLISGSDTVSPYLVRDKIVSLAEEFVADGGTPVVDTMYEAYLYINGKNVKNGYRRGTSNRRKTLSRISHPDTFSGSGVTTPSDCDLEKLTSIECSDRAITTPSDATYISPLDPILGQCQANYIVLFSDGAPNNTYEDDEIRTLTGSSCENEACATVLAEYMAKKPSERGASNTDAQVFTYTVGFESAGFNDQYLKDLAEAGEGQFYSGSTAAELANAFTSIFIEAKKGASTFVAPGISVNQFNRLTHSNDIYYALFDPKSTEYWPGNLKKYKLIDSIVYDNSSEPAISSDGFFRDNAHDWWAISSSITSPFVGRGGSAARQEVPRRVYSNLTNRTVPLADGDSRITKANLGIESEPNADDLRVNLIDWMRGYDVQDSDNDGNTNEPRFQMADPLHSEPLFFQYGDQASVYIGTNEGYLLSIDADTGKENWAFIPEDLLPNINVYFENGSVFNSRTYGMDGAIAAWQEDGKSYIIVGQRRGGRNYYVFDVTSRMSPIYKYKIEGGQGDYSNLGQSWSKPTITSIDVNGTTHKVLVFGGGYDTNQDSNTFRSKDSFGNSVFIVKASTGNKIAEISSSNADYIISDMEYGIPARIAVIDRDFDGKMDHMYVADVGGNLYRIDVYNGETLSKLFNGKRIYTTSQPLSLSKNRRYYYAPDVAEIVHKQEHYYAVSIGSGYRAHPLNEDIEDSVIMIKDKGVFAKEDGLYTFPTISNIAQITPTQPTVSDMTSYDGYEFNLVKGEKVITGVSILNSKLVFSTYDPSTAGLVENSCSAAQGGGRIYVIDLLDGGALLDVDGDGDIDYEDTYVELDKSGIPAEPRLIITDPDAPTLCIGTECADTVESADDENNAFKKLLGSISGRRSLLNQIFTNSWSTEVEPTTKDDN